MQRNFFSGAIDGRVMSRRRAQNFLECEAMSTPTTRLSFWGVRGSTPTVDPATWRYGGNTPCLEVQAPDGTQFILDCGTGLRMLGNRWVGPHGTKAAEAHIFVTHY